MNKQTSSAATTSTSSAIRTTTSATITIQIPSHKQHLQLQHTHSHNTHTQMKDSFEADNGLIFAAYPDLKEHIPEHILLQTYVQHCPGFFSSLTCLKKPVFSKRGRPSAVECTSQACTGKVPRYPALPVTISKK
jgi:hypothetical protein